jgi:hypothetical protein
MSLKLAVKRGPKHYFRRIIEIAGLCRYIPPYVGRNFDLFITTFDAIEIREDRTIKSTVSHIGYLSKIDLFKKQLKKYVHVY